MVAAGRGTRLPDSGEEAIEDNAEREALRDRGRRIAVATFLIAAVFTAAFYVLPI